LQLELSDIYDLAARSFGIPVEQIRKHVLGSGNTSALPSKARKIAACNKLDSIVAHRRDASGAAQYGMLGRRILPLLTPIPSQAAVFLA